MKILKSIKKWLGLERAPAPARRQAARPPRSAPLPDPCDVWRRHWWRDPKKTKLFSLAHDGLRRDIALTAFVNAMLPYVGDKIQLVSITSQIVNNARIDPRLREDALREGRARLAEFVDVDDYVTGKYGWLWHPEVAQMLLEAELMHAGLERAELLQRERREAEEQVRIKKMALRPSRKLEMGEER